MLLTYKDQIFRFCFHDWFDLFWLQDWCFNRWVVLWFADHSNDSDVSHSADMDTRAPNIIGCLCVFVSFLYFPQVSLRFYSGSRHFLLLFPREFNRSFRLWPTSLKCLIGSKVRTFMINRVSNYLTLQKGKVISIFLWAFVYLFVAKGTKQQ